MFWSIYCQFSIRKDQVPILLLPDVSVWVKLRASLQVGLAGGTLAPVRDCLTFIKSDFSKEQHMQQLAADLDQGHSPRQWHCLCALLNTFGCRTIKKMFLDSGWRTASNSLWVYQTSWDERQLII